MTSLGYVTFITTIFGLLGRVLLGFGQNPVKKSLRFLRASYTIHMHALTVVGCALFFSYSVLDMP